MIIDGAAMIESMRRRDARKKLDSYRGMKFGRKYIHLFGIGNVYFLQGEQTGNIKIGIATHVNIRLKAIQSCSPDILNVLLVLQGGRKLERTLHCAFGGDRLHGEWFSPSSKLMEWIEQHKDMGKDWRRS